MENTLTIISIVSVVVFIIFITFVIRSTKKESFATLIGYAISSAAMCALDIISILIKTNLNQSYEMNIVNLCIYAVNALLAVFFIVERTVSKSKVELTIKIVDITDEDTEDTQK